MTSFQRQRSKKNIMNNDTDAYRIFCLERNLSTFFNRSWHVVLWAQLATSTSNPFEHLNFMHLNTFNSIVIIIDRQLWLEKKMHFHVFYKVLSEENNDSASFKNQKNKWNIMNTNVISRIDWKYFPLKINKINFLFIQYR